MSVIDINTVGLQNLFELVDESCSCSFNTKDIENLRNIIRVSLDRIDFLVREASS
jgi:hypothetical protein